MKHYVIMCQFYNASSSKIFENTIKHLDIDYQHPAKNIWYIHSHYSIDNIQQHLLSEIEINDSLIINEIQDQRVYNAFNDHYAPIAPMKHRLFA